MAHQSENSFKLASNHTAILEFDQLQSIEASKDVYFFVLPTNFDNEYDYQELITLFHQFSSKLPEQAVLAVLATPKDAAHILNRVETNNQLHFKLWIAIKTVLNNQVSRKLPEKHLALLILSPYKTALKHTKTQIAYTYCPSCGKTTKDYGGKKHLYHEYGTLMSDVWRDVELDPSVSLEPVTSRLRDVFGLEPHRTLHIVDFRKYKFFSRSTKAIRKTNSAPQAENNMLVSELKLGDCLEMLRTIPDNSIDFCFADPPYNLKKKYQHWDDALEITAYFEWCDKWLAELIRVLKPGRTLAVLNIPQWAARHYEFLSKHLVFQNWIAWDAISLPVRLIMPSHYGILCFTKGETRELPVLTNNKIQPLLSSKEFFCVRSSCVKNRKTHQIADKEPLSDLWHDIHRVKHNSQRVDHPCQLPPTLMHRLISTFTLPGEIVLDCFNGVGTTTLVAAQLNRRYIGIEISPEYYALAQQRHLTLEAGFDPFGKTQHTPKAKNSRVKRLPKQKYEVSKKVLQLEVKKIAQQLARIPTREEVSRLGKYPVEYYDQYFISWSEACAAARTTGMSELPKTATIRDQNEAIQLTLALAD